MSEGILFCKAIRHIQGDTMVFIFIDEDKIIGDSVKCPMVLFLVILMITTPKLELVRNVFSYFIKYISVK